MTSPVRVTTQDATGQSKVEWIHTKPDHLYHASVYDTVARRLLQAESAAVPGFVSITRSTIWR
jgi:hypothetical protein